MILRLILWIVLATLAHILLYRQPLGLNVTVTISLGLAALFHLKNFKVKYPLGFLAVFAVAASSFYNANAMGLIIGFVGLITLVGAETESIQQALFSFFAGLHKLFHAPRAIKESSNRTKRDISQKSKVKWVYFMIPTLFSIVFIAFYASGIPAFGEVIDLFFSDTWDLIVRLFSGFSILATLFFALMLFSTAFLVFNSRPSEMSELEKKTPLVVTKRKHALSPFGDLLEGLHLIPKRGVMALRHELKISVLLIISLNAIIFIALVAGAYGLMHPELTQDTPSYQQVHEGTFNLIVSLVLGAVLVIYFFRGNLNFFKQSSLLKKLSVLWLVQNLLLALLDTVYNFEYIDGYGLTYKRIGVYFFLFLTAVGLVVVFFKLQYQYSTFNTFKIGVYAAVLFGAVVSPINWDGIIVSHNLRKGLDKASLLPYTIDLSYRSIPELIEHEEFYSEYINPVQGYYTDIIDRKIAHYRVHQQGKLPSKSLLRMRVDQAIETYQNQSSDDK